MKWSCVRCWRWTAVRGSETATKIITPAEGKTEGIKAVSDGGEEIKGCRETAQTALVLSIISDLCIDRASLKEGLEYESCSRRTLRHPENCYMNCSVFCVLRCRRGSELCSRSRGNFPETIWMQENTRQGKKLKNRGDQLSLDQADNQLKSEGSRGSNHHVPGNTGIYTYIYIYNIHLQWCQFTK